MLIGTQLAGFGAGGTASPVTLEFSAGALTPSGATTTHTFASHAIGAPGAGRYVVVCVGCFVVAINSVTVNGGSTTSLVSLANTANIRMFVTNVPVPTGTTASIVVNIVSPSANVIMATYALYDPQSTTPHDTKTTTTDNTALNISVPAGGVCVGIGCGTPSANFTVSNGSEDYDINIPFNMATAHTTTTGTVGLTFDSSGTLYGAMAASFL